MPGDTEHYQMQGDAPALLYERYLVPVIASRWADDLVERGAPKSGERVLDVACGTGIVARTAARGIQMGRVAALDMRVPADREHQFQSIVNTRSSRW